MSLRGRHFNPFAVGIVIVVVLVIAVLSLSAPRMGNIMSDISSSLNQESYAYAPLEAGIQPAAPPMAGAGEFAYQADIDDVKIAEGRLANVQDARQRVILKSASLQIVVDAPESSLASIASMADEMGGWVVTSTTSMVTTPTGQSVAQGSITIRVPSDRLDDALTRIKSGAGEVKSETVSGQDVTQDYVDLSSRLTNLEAAEAQLRSIMEDARRTEDVLAVYNQLVSTRGEIERIRGQLQYYDEAAAYSSISVTLIPTAIDTPVQIAGWSPGRTVENALASLINVLQFGADLLITVVVLVVPLLLILALPLWFACRALRRQRA